MYSVRYRLLNLVLKLLMSGREAADYGLFHPRRSMLAKAHADTIAFISANMPNALGFDMPKQLLEHAIRAVSNDGIVAEFGVNTGGTINHIAKTMPARKVHGFDSFQGLPEAWQGYNLDAGHFSRQGRLPRVRGNVTLHPGWFDDTLPPFVKSLSKPIALLHVDCDIYSSTRTVFQHLKNHIVPGTVIVFDEFFNYPNWQAHEYKAYMEFVSERGIGFDYLAYSYEQVAVVVRGTDGPGLSACAGRSSVVS
jgi:hypothetical protein